MLVAVFKKIWISKILLQHLVESICGRLIILWYGSKHRKTRTDFSFPPIKTNNISGETIFCQLYILCEVLRMSWIIAPEVIATKGWLQFICTTISTQVYKCVNFVCSLVSKVELNWLPKHDRYALRRFFIALQWFCSDIKEN